MTAHVWRQRGGGDLSRGKPGRAGWGRHGFRIMLDSAEASASTLLLLRGDLLTGPSPSQVLRRISALNWNWSSRHGSIRCHSRNFGGRGKLLHRIFLRHARAGPCVGWIGGFRVRVTAHEALLTLFSLACLCIRSHVGKIKHEFTQEQVLRCLSNDLFF